MVSFMRATLGFESEMMREASDQLAEAETSAAEHQRHAQRDPSAYHSAMYPYGSEYALCNAMAQLMSAVVAVMSESLTEGIRGFYKLRKAYATLDGIIDAEGRYVQSNPNSRAPTPLTSSFSPRGMNGTASKAPNSAQIPTVEKSKLSQATGNAPPNAERTQERNSDTEDDDDDDFQDADESHETGKLSSYSGYLEINGSTQRTHHDSPDNPSPRPSFDENLPQFSESKSLGGIERLLSHDPSSTLFENPIDVFVHSGTNLCYGILLTMLSLIPPAFGRLLSIVGFRGDRERGLRMLWQASKFHNVNGAMAGLCLFGYYNGIVGSCDILTESTIAADGHETVTGYPTRRLDALLTDMRGRFPQSKLWQLEEARMNSVRKDLSGSLAMLAGDIRSPLKQVHALAVFERSLQAMFAHDYALCSASFQECMDLNNWSPALYMFIAGAAQLELYRRARGTSSTPKQTQTAEALAAKAAGLLQSARAHAGKKRFMARQLPLDVYVIHCLNKWDAQAKALKVPFVDAIGTSPLEIMAYMWSGHKKMSPQHLEASLQALDHASPASVAEAPDEVAMRAVLRAACFRSLGRTEDARAVLQRDVLGLEHTALRGPLRDDWPAPVAHYEMAAALWAERGALAKKGDDGIPSEAEKRLVREAEEELNKAAKWERYMLDARVGVRVTTGLDTVKRWRTEHDSLTT